MPQRLYIKLFKNEDKLYCYDVGSNQIMRIKDVLGDVLRLYNYTNEEEVLNKLAPKYRGRDVKNSIEFINKFNKEQDGFILQKKVTLHFPFSKDEYNVLLDSYLSYLILNVSEDCNFRCKYCSYSGTYEFSRVHQKKSMSWETARDAIDFLIKRSYGVLESTDRGLALGFYGGEPLLEKELIFQSLNYIESSYPDIFPKFKFLMTTNGSLLNEETIKQLVKYNFYISVSLDGPHEVHDRYRVFENGKGSFGIIKRNLDLLKALDPVFFKEKVSFSIMMPPEIKLLETIDFFKKEYPEQHGATMFSMIDAFDTTFFDTFDMDEEEKKFAHQNELLKAEYIKNKAYGHNDEYLSCYFKEDLSIINDRYIFPLPDVAYPNGICPPGLQRIFVDTSGNIHICEKGNQNFEIGNIRTGFDVDKIYFYIEEYIKTTDNCENCWAIRFCKDCLLTAMRENKFSKEKKKINCNYRKQVTMNWMKIYVEILDRSPDAFSKGHSRKNDVLEDALEYIRSQK